MSRVRLGDDFADHPKIRKLDKTALVIHIWTLCHVARHLTDGRVSRGMLAGCPWVSKKSALERALGNLVGAGVWEQDGEDFRIHDYLKYNPDSVQVKESRRLKAERQARWLVKKKDREDASRKASTNGHRDASRDAPPTPTPKGVGVEAGASLEVAPLLGQNETAKLCIRCHAAPPAHDDAVICSGCAKADLGTVSLAQGRPT